MNKKLSAATKTHNFNLIVDVINALQIEINILKEKDKLREKHTNDVLGKLNRLIDLASKIVDHDKLIRHNKTHVKEVKQNSVNKKDKTKCIIKQTTIKNKEFAYI